MEIRSKYFSEKELRCKCSSCNKEKPHKCLPEALARLDELREAVGRPLSLTSAYRCEKHPSEASKVKAGQHNQGTAFDISVKSGAEGYEVMQRAFELGFTGIAYGNGFVHVDIRKGTPVIWRY